ncbi:MAG: hypothetical protein PHC83_01630 [Bacteroidales bacterium]|nr:hypothetical protein [Bacteroidales bacterium]
MDNNNPQYFANEPDNTKNKRPAFLTTLCILTFIGSGFSLLSQIFSYAYYDKIPDMMINMAGIIGGQYGKMYLDLAETFSSMPPYYFLLLAVVYFLSITGATLMILLRKIGFHIYTISQLLVIGLPLLILHAPFNIGNLLLALAFVLFYARYLKIMK